MRGCDEHVVDSPNEFNKGSIIQQHECKILFIIWHQKSSKRQDLSIRKRDVFMDVNANNVT